VLNAWLNGLASEDQRRLTGNGSALETLRCTDSRYVTLDLLTRHNEPVTTDCVLTAVTASDDYKCTVLMRVTLWHVRVRLDCVVGRAGYSGHGRGEGGV